MMRQPGRALLRQARTRFQRAAFTGLLLALACLLTDAAQVEARDAGRFDYYVLALSWSPSYCARAGRSADPMQCRATRPFRFVLHGLWPQYERGYPEFCRLPQGSDLSRETIDGMLDLMPSRGLVRHQWRKHGSCSGLDPEAYFDLSRRAFARVKIPAAFTATTAGGQVSPDAVETAFRLANPGLRDNAIAVTCEGGRLSEVRVCLTRDLQFRSCRWVDRRGCTQRQIHVPPPAR